MNKNIHSRKMGLNLWGAVSHLDFIIPETENDLIKNKLEESRKFIIEVMQKDYGYNILQREEE